MDHLKQRKKAGGSHPSHLDGGWCSMVFDWFSSFFCRFFLPLQDVWRGSGLFFVKTLSSKQQHFFLAGRVAGLIRVVFFGVKIVHKSMVIGGPLHFSSSFCHDAHARQCPFEV